MNEGIKYFALTLIIIVAVLAVTHGIKDPPDQETAEKWQNDPANWKMGMFYYNPQDNRIFPPKRIKTMGWTVNFGNSFSIAAFIVLLATLIYLTRKSGL